MKHCPLHHVSYVPRKFEVAMGQWLRRCITKKIHYIQGQRVKVTVNVAQYPQHHVTFAPTKFDVATSYG